MFSQTKFTVRPIKLVFLLFFIFLLLVPVAVVVGQLYPDYYRSNKNTLSPSFYPPGESIPCIITNTTVLDYFIPFKTITEWSAVKSAALNITGLSIACNQTCYDCSDRVGLASVNDGLNCGLNLNNGCGGTVNCTSCGAGEVCNRGYPTSNCSIINMIGCETPEITQGYCANDHGCNMVVDASGVLERGRLFCIDGPGEAVCPITASRVGPMNKVYSIGGACSMTGGTECYNYASLGDRMHVSIDGVNILLYHWSYYSSSDGNFLVESCTGSEPDPSEPDPSEPGGPSQPVEPPPPLEVY